MPNDSEFKADIISRTASQWSSLNPFLDKNDLGIETDTGRCKVGAGIKWADTAYVGPTGFTGQVTISDAAGEHVFTFASGLLTDHEIL